jgi:hypothetical protein
MEQSRQARRFFDLDWFGMGAAGAVDPMVASGVGLRECSSSTVDYNDYVKTLMYLPPSVQAPEKWTD